jgi:CelD/BcsL family acetyltransferase involved in cellulose biosynthesis
MVIRDEPTLVAGGFDGLMGHQALRLAEYSSGTGELGLGDVLTRVIEHEADFETLERPWSALAAACRAHPFQDFAWARAWIHTIGRTDGRQLRIATLWDRTRLLGVLPLVRSRYFGIHLLEWVGARAADYCDALIHPSLNAGSALLMLWNAVAARRDYDVIRLGQVRDDAKINALFTAVGVNPWIETREETYFIPVRCKSGEEWLQAQGAHARKQTRYDVRHLAKAGFEYYVWKSPDPYERIVEALIAQKSAWMAHQGLGPLLSHREGANFLRECIAEMAARGILHLSAFRSRTEFAACHLGFYQHGVLYGYMPTYDPQWGTYSAGAAIRDAFVMWACDHGVQRVDLLRGAGCYKLRYKPEHEWLQTLVIPRGLIGRVCLAGYRLLH